MSQRLVRVTAPLVLGFSLQGVATHLRWR